MEGLSTPRRGGHDARQRVRPPRLYALVAAIVVCGWPSTAGAPSSGRRSWSGMADFRRAWRGGSPPTIRMLSLRGGASSQDFGHDTAVMTYDNPSMYGEQAWERDEYLNGDPRPLSDGKANTAVTLGSVEDNLAGQSLDATVFDDYADSAGWKPATDAGDIQAKWGGSADGQSTIEKFSVGMDAYLERTLSFSSNGTLVSMERGAELEERMTGLDKRYKHLLDGCKKLYTMATDPTSKRKFELRLTELEAAARTMMKIPQHLLLTEWTQEDRFNIESVEYQLDSVEYSVGSLIPEEKEYPSVWVTFVLKCDSTQLGDKVLVTGECEELGEWNIEKACVLSTDPDTYPKWNVTVPLKAGEVFAYKYCIGKPSETAGEYAAVVWEGHMGNREIKVHRNVNRPQVTEDEFVPQEDHLGNIADSSSPKFVHMHSNSYQEPEYVYY